MHYYNLCPKTKAIFLFSDTKVLSLYPTLNGSALYKIIYNTGKTAHIKINERRYVLKKGHMLFCKPLDIFEVVSRNKELKILAFNSDFYQFNSIQEKVNFYSFWFFGVQYPFKIILTDTEQTYCGELLDVLLEELDHTKVLAAALRQALRHFTGIASLGSQIAVMKSVLNRQKLGVVKKFNQFVASYLSGKIPSEAVQEIFNLNALSLLQFLNNYPKVIQYSHYKEIIGNESYWEKHYRIFRKSPKPKAAIPIHLQIKIS